jgi:hypothetical protein
MKEEGRRKKEEGRRKKEEGRNIFLFELTSYTFLNQLFRNGQDARSTREFIGCGTGKMPVPENGARSEFELTSKKNS